MSKPTEFVFVDTYRSRNKKTGKRQEVNQFVLDFPTNVSREIAQKISQTIEGVARAWTTRNKLHIRPVKGHLWRDIESDVKLCLESTRGTNLQYVIGRFAPIGFVPSTSLKQAPLL